MKHERKRFYRVTAHVIDAGWESTSVEESVVEAFDEMHAVYIAGQMSDGDAFPLTVEVEEWTNPDAEDDR